VVRGSVAERVERIVELFGLPTVMPQQAAIEIATERVARAIEVLEDDARLHAARRAKSWRQRLGYALRY
jgi:hypothetical protein